MTFGAPHIRLAASICMALAVPAAAHAQGPTSTNTIGGSGSSAQMPTAATTQPPSTVTEPIGTTVTRVPVTRTPSTSSDPNRVYLENADRLRLDDNDVATATGNVRVRFRDNIVNAGKAVIDTKHRVAVFSQRVQLYSAVSSLDIHTTSTDDTIQLDLRDGTYHVVGHESGQIPPSQLSSAGIVSPLYVHGENIDGAPTLIDARLMSITSCEFEQPHYSFLAETVRILPGKRLIARHVTLFRHGHRILTIPLVVLPLDQRYARQEYIPQVGVSPDEGYFAKFGIPYTVGAIATGLARLDLMSKKGVGYGFDQDYRPPFDNHPAKGDSGMVKFYTLNDKSTGLRNLNISLDQSERIFGGFQSRLDSQFSDNAYQLSNTHSETLSNNLTLFRTTRAMSTNIAASLQQSNYGFGTNTNMNGSFAQHWQIQQRGAADMRFTFAGFQTPGIAGASGTTNQTLASNGSYLAYSGGMSYELKIDANSVLRSSSGVGSFGSVERLPELNIKTDSTNTNLRSPVLRLLPFLSTAGVSYGRYHDPSASIRTDRTQVTATVDNVVTTHKALTTTFSSSFEQDFYGDDAARYVLAGHYEDDYQFGRSSHFTADYQTQRPYGYTPFFWDSLGKYDNASATLSFQPSRSVGVNLVTGYDFTRATTINGLPAAPWQNLSAQLVLKPNKALTTQFATTYDLNTGHLYAVSNMLRVGFPWGFKFATGTQYVPNQHRISSITGSLTLPVMSDAKHGVGYKLDALEGYNGYTRKFTYYGFQLTRSWHDVELSGVLQNNLGNLQPGTSFYLNLRLKAFPGIQPFGTGQFGQGLSTGTSDVF